MTIFLLLQRRTEAIAAWTCRSACCAHVTTSPCSLRDEPAQCHARQCSYLFFFPYFFSSRSPSTTQATTPGLLHRTPGSPRRPQVPPHHSSASSRTGPKLCSEPMPKVCGRIRHARFSLLLPSSCFPSSPLLLRLLWPSVPTFFESCCQRRNDQQQLLNTVSLLTVRRMQPQRWLM